MTLRRRMTSALAVLGMAAATTAGLVATGPSATASHYRATQLTWHQVSGNTAEFHFTGSWRCTFFFNPCNPSPGQTFFPANLNFGDGTGTNPAFTVVAVDPVNDVVTGEAHFSHTYSSSGPFTAFSSVCCRLSRPQHINNPDDNNRVETIVNLGATSANPVSSIAPIVDCPINAVCQFSVPAVDPDGQDLRWRFSTSAEAAGGSTFEQPGPPHAPNAATINASTGVYTWDTTGATLSGGANSYYSTQVMVENLVGGVVVSKTPVDFFIRLTNTPNKAPQFQSPTPADGTVINATVGSPVTFDVIADDPDTGDTVTLGIIGSPAGAFTSTSANPATGTFNWTPSAARDVILNLTAQDQHGLGAVQRSVTIHVVGNQPPSVDGGADVSGSEGSPVALDGTVTDPDPGDTITTLWSYAAGGDVDAGATCSFDDASAVDTTVTCTDDGTYTLTLTGDDGDAAVTDTVTLIVSNVAPEITSLTVPMEPVPVGTAVSVSGTFTDAGANDAHTAEWDWDGSTTSAGTVSGGDVSGTHTYTEAGVYTICLTVDDDDSGSDSQCASSYVVVYDPSAGFVTGGGWIQSPAGAFPADPDLTGKANFGFVSKYKKGQSVPDGNTQFQFQAGGLNFHSTAYDWLVIAGAKAIYKGSGTVNGEAGYGFLVSAIDGQKPGGGGADKFRIKIWDISDGTVVYDNQPGDGDDASAQTTLGGGSIVIHG
jgi:PKD repeat protein